MEMGLELTGDGEVDEETACFESNPRLMMCGALWEISFGVIDSENGGWLNK